jgi:3',5'-cyclic AMP phosphodiesterase CpdA
MRRREFLGIGVVFASGLACGKSPKAQNESHDDFFFLQLSDTHWGFRGPPNPEAETVLPKVVASIAAMSPKPDFVVMTGDLTHKVEDDAERRKRLTEVKTMMASLGTPVHFIPGEHDVPDGGAVYREVFGEATHWAFAHKGVSFIAVDNVIDKAGVGAAQLEWLAREVAKVPRDAALVVFTHRPLFELQPDWDWTTDDGAEAIRILSGHEHVIVFYGHIHQEHHHMTGNIAHHSARSLVFPLPAPGSVPKKAPLPWDAASPDHGLGYRSIDRAVRAREIKIT